MKELTNLKQFTGLDQQQQQCQLNINNNVNIFNSDLKQIGKNVLNKTIQNNNIGHGCQHAQNKGSFKTTTNLAYASSSLPLVNHKPSLGLNVPHVYQGLKPRDIIKSRVMHGSAFNLDIDPEDAFYVADLGDVVRQFHLFKRLLPRVEPFYAMKCCPDPMVMRILNELGTGFDCASKGEIESVLEMGVEPSRVIYANPCKQSSHLRYAFSRQVKMMTFDNEDELIKIKKYHPEGDLVLRVLTDNSRSLCNLGLKFGASLEKVPRLLQAAKELNLNVIGISFHVGSGCYDASAFGDAVLTARKAFDIGESLGFQFNFLDIGGGFPGNKATGITFPEIAAIVGPLIDQHFPPQVRVIAEPGRFFISAAFTLSLHITSRRTVYRDNQKTPIKKTDPSSTTAQNCTMMMVDEEQDQDNRNADQHPSYMYYVNDGMYGSFNCLTFDHATVHAQVLVRNNKFVYGKNKMNQNGEAQYVEIEGNSSSSEEGDSVYSSDEEKGTSSSSSSPSISSHEKKNLINHQDLLFKCSIWGPTCDSIDCIGKDVLLPELNVGDWLVYEDMGAYTMCAASTFNGFRKSAIIYTNTEV